MRGRVAVQQAQMLVVDWPRCEGHGLCAEVLPELVTLDEWGYPVVDGTVPDDLRRDAARARDVCPAVALRLQRTTTAVSRPDRSPDAPTRDDRGT